MYRRDIRDTKYDSLLADMSVTDTNYVGAQVRPEPSGERIAYTKNRENRSDIWLSDGNGPGQQLTNGNVAASPWDRYRVDSRSFDWHPDGTSIAYVEDEDETTNINIVNTTTGEKTQLTNHREMDLVPRYSPNGSELAFITDYWSSGTLAVMSENGNQIERLCDDNYIYGDPIWKDNEALYAVRTRHRDVFDDETEIVQVSRSGDLEIIFKETDTLSFAPRPRPKTSEVAFIHEGNGFKGLYITDNGGETEALWDTEETVVGAPEWDKEGNKLVVTIQEGGETHIWTISRDGDTEQISSGKGRYYAPAWQEGDVFATVSTPAQPNEVKNFTTDETIATSDLVGFEERLITPESTWYESTDDRKIHAIVYLPDGMEEQEPDSVPLLVHPHGGPTAYDGYEFNYPAQYFAALGYAVIEPNYRGSEGFGREFRQQNDYAWGDGDLDDVVNAADALADQYDPIDRERAGIFGGSGGGLMTVNALGKTDRFLAGAAFYGPYDYETFINDTDEIGWRLFKSELGFPATHIENYRDASPIRNVEDIEAPLLVLHGEDDKRVPINQSEQLVKELEKQGKQYDFQRYQGEAHGFTQRENIVDSYTRIADLFAKYLKIDPGTNK